MQLQSGPRAVLPSLLAAVLCVVLGGCAQPSGPGRTRPVSLVGLGDSVTSGAHCDCVPFLDRLGDLLTARNHQPVSPVNLGVPGMTATGLAARLREDPGVRRAVSWADVVVVTVGANDLQPALDRWDRSGTSARIAPGCADGSETAALARARAGLASVLDQVRTLRAGHPTRVLVTDYWNVFEDGDVALADRGRDYLRWSDQLTRCLNQRIDEVARSHGALLVDLYTPFKGAGDLDPTALLADDGDHPDAAGHAAIAGAIIDALPAPGRR